MPMAAVSPPSLSFLSSVFPKSRLFTSKPTASSSSSSSSSSHSLSVKAASQLPVLSFATGDKIGDAILSLRSAPADTARAVVHRGIVTDLQNRRRGTASTLTRSEVRGGGKKPYPQKKLGRARRGSQRTPLRPGGGVVFGPKPKDWSAKINRKEKRLALSTAIASAAAAEDAFVVDDGFADAFIERPRTKGFIGAMGRWGLDPSQKATFLMMDVPDNVRLSSRNIKTIKMLTPRTLNLFDVLDAKKLVLTRSTVDYLNSIYGEYVEDEDDGEGDEAGGASSES